MSKECSINIYEVFNDRGSVVCNLTESIGIDSSCIVSGETLPQWRFGSDCPVVDYYDGECISLSFRGKKLRTRAGNPEVELFSAIRPNIHVQESVSVRLALNCAGKTDNRDFAAIFRNGSFSALVINAIHETLDNEAAARYFTRIFTSSENMFLLGQPALDMLSEEAGHGNPHALFGLGRYHFCVRPEQESVRIARECFNRAYMEGLAEAGAGLAQMYRYGDMGPVDREKAASLLEDTAGKGCEFAVELQTKDMIWGTHGCEANPGAALGIINSFIGKEKTGNEINPKWHYLKACALQQVQSISAAREYYEYAAANGIISAWADCAIAASHNDEGELVDRDSYIRRLSEGAEMRDCLSIYLLAMSGVEGYDDMPPYRKAYERCRLDRLLEKAYGLGSAEAAETLGDIYFNGWFDTPEDDAAAWEWYSRAGTLCSASAYEKMYCMARDGYVDKDRRQMDICALYGARLGSRYMLDETVIAGSQGRLAEFSTEIGRYYAPIFDSEDDTGDDEPVDDDGRYDAYV